MSRWGATGRAARFLAPVVLCLAAGWGLTRAAMPEAQAQSASQICALRGETWALDITAVEPPGGAGDPGWTTLLVRGNGDVVVGGAPNPAADRAFFVVEDLW